MNTNTFRGETKTEKTKNADTSGINHQMLTRISGAGEEKAIDYDDSGAAKCAPARSRPTNETGADLRMQKNSLSVTSLKPLLPK